MKKILLFLVVLVLSLNTQAQDKGAKQLLDDVSSKVKGYGNIVIGFKYTLNNAETNVAQETRGDVSIKGNKYLLNIMGTTRMFDGNKIYDIIPEDEEINISAQNEDEDASITPSKMLTFYEEGYTHKMDILQNVKGRQIQYVKLIPINSNSDLKQIMLGIDKQTKHIYNMVQTQNNGTQITITVNSFKTNQPLSETLFTFDESKYSNYYINRLD